MNKNVCFLILDIGIRFEKGRMSGNFWKISEKKRLNNEIRFWQDILRCIRRETAGEDCSDTVFSLLSEIAQKYRLPGYDLILANWHSLYLRTFETDFVTEQKICSLMEQILEEALKENNKHKKYSLLRTLHNLPRCMHGASCIQPGFRPISPEEALKYAGLDGCEN